MENDIRDIHGPVPLPNPYLWLLYALVILLVLALLYACWRWYLKRRLLPAKSSYEIAMEELEKARTLLRTDQVRPYVFTVSEIVRNYIEKRFHVLAAHRTTEEFLHDLVHSQSSSLSGYISLFEIFLKNCDLVKFGKWSMTLPEMEAMHGSAVNFVQQTKPEEKNDQHPNPQPR